MRQQLAADGIDAEFVLAGAKQTAQSVILYDSTGRRQIHVGLKDIQKRAAGNLVAMDVYGLSVTPATVPRGFRW